MTVTETINRMIEIVIRSSTWTSAGGKNESVENFIKELRGVENPDLEAETKSLIESGGEGKSADGKETEISGIKGDLKNIKEGNLGELGKLSQDQIGNVKGLAQNPVKMMGSMFTKFAKVAGPVAVAFIIWEAVQFIISELLKSGRLLDRKFKRDIRFEILAFRTREEKQKLKQGFARIIVTSMPRLRGGQFQTYDSFRQRQSQLPVFREGPFVSPQINPASGRSQGKGKNVFGVGG